jgi:hypothetical protein
MNEFDRRWQDCAARARQEAAGAVQVPAGLATRVWARHTAESSDPRAGAWASLSLRALILATIALIVCAVTELCTAPPASAFAPHLEDMVTSVWGRL